MRTHHIIIWCVLLVYKWNSSYICIALDLDFDIMTEYYN